ncbi:polymorphic toxin type 22 domain-containing protein [Burkholderia sp. MSMB1078WGS]
MYTAVEFGIGQPGSISFGVMPWGHSAGVTERGK